MFNFQVGRSVDEALRLIKGFQFVEKHGEGNGESSEILDDLSKTSAIFKNRNH